MQSENFKIIGGKRYFYFPRLLDIGLKHVYTTNDLSPLWRKCREDRKALTDVYEAFSALSVMTGKTEKNKSLNFIPEQIHSNLVKDLNLCVKNREGVTAYPFGNCIEACDGLVTDMENTALASSSADCVSLLVFDHLRKVQANIHSGWKGTLNQIIRAAIRVMKKDFLSAPENMYLAIFPHIGRRDFEVREDVARQFSSVYPGSGDRFIIRKDEEHSLVDLAECIKFSAEDEGIKSENILESALSTYSEKNFFHSYRRDGKEFSLQLLLSEIKL